MKTILIISNVAYLATIIFATAEGRLKAIKGMNPKLNSRLVLGIIASLMINFLFLYREVPNSNWWPYDKPFVSFVASFFMAMAFVLLYRFSLGFTYSLSKTPPLEIKSNKLSLEAWEIENKSHVTWMYLVGATLFILFYNVWIINSL